MAIMSSNTMKESGGESERKDKLLRGQYVGCHTITSFAS